MSDEKKYKFYQMTDDRGDLRVQGAMFWLNMLGFLVSWVVPVYYYCVHSWWQRWMP